MIRIEQDEAELAFRALFCMIFIGLGGEHLLADDLIQNLMPVWVPFKRAVSIMCGVWLMFWGSLILIGWKIKWAAFFLGVFLVVVTLAVHVPGVLEEPNMAVEYSWMWVVLQRSNLVKNICLLGVCFQLLYHKPGRYSLESYFKRQQPDAA